jgi:uncharacterized protein involved in type VI secretion and phage assembly
MEAQLNAMRREAERTLSNVAQPRMAIVSSYDPDRYAVKVRMQPENFETGWMPLATPGAGNGFGVFIPPAIGDQVLLTHIEGAGGSPVAVAAIYSDEDRPVVDDIGGCPANEIRIVHKSGARLRLLGDGQIEIRAKDGVQVVLKPDGTVTNPPPLDASATAALKGA